MKKIYFFLMGIIFLSSINAGDRYSENFIQRMKKEHKKWSKRTKKVPTADPLEIIEQLIQVQKKEPSRITTSIALNQENPQAPAKDNEHQN